MGEPNLKICGKTYENSATGAALKMCFAFLNVSRR